MGREGSGARRHGTLVLFPGALGDAVCVEPAVRWLARDGPVSFCARGAAAEAAALFPSYPHARSLDAPEVARLFAPAREGTEAPDWLRDFDAIVSFTGASSAELRARLEATGRARIVPFPERHGAVHACDEMLAGVGGPAGGAAAWPRLAVPAVAAPAEGSRPRLALHPGSGGARKRVAPEILVEVAKRWRAHAAGSVTVLLGPAEAGEDALWRSAEPVERVVRPESVAALAAELAGADAYLGCDSGPSHVAAALGLRATVAFVATDPARFGPRGRRTVHVDLAASGDVSREAAIERIWAAARAALP